jgi:hypothetical protein
MTPWWLSPLLEFLAGLWTGTVVTLMVQGARELRRLQAELGEYRSGGGAHVNCPLRDGQAGYRNPPRRSPHEHLWIEDGGVDAPVG